MAAIDVVLAAGDASAAARAALELPHTIGLDVRIACLARAHQRLGREHLQLRYRVGQTLAVCLFRRGRARASLDTLADALVDAQEACDEPAAVRAETVGASFAGQLGARAESDLLFAAALERAARSCEPSLGFVLGVLGARDLDDGDAGAAAAGLTRALVLCEAEQPRFGVWLTACRARALARCDRLPEAVDSLAPALTRAVAHEPEGLVVVCLDAFAELAARLGCHDESAQTTASVTRIRAAIGSPRLAHEQAAAREIATAHDGRGLPLLSRGDAIGLAGETLAELAR